MKTKHLHDENIQYGNFGVHLFLFDRHDEVETNCVFFIAVHKFIVRLGLVPVLNTSMRNGGHVTTNNSLVALIQIF